MKPTPIGRFVDTPSYEELQEEIARLRLTDAEREAIIVASIELNALAMFETNHAAALRGLLERTTL
jgi:hypothetical protein